MTPAQRARGMVEARLSRPAQDELEAAVVLEAWCGIKATSALALGRKIVRRDGGSASPKGFEPEKQSRRSGAIAEGIALVLVVVCVASWASPMTREFGAATWDGAVRLALPLTLALQWLLWSRYLAREAGLGTLRRDAIRVFAGGVTILGAIASLGPSGLVAAMLVATWMTGPILARRGWVLWYSLLLALVAVGLHLGAPGLPLLGASAVTGTSACVIALARHRSGDSPPGSWSQAILAALVGGALGALLVADRTIGWGVYGYLPALGLIPSTVGGILGGHSLAGLYVELPRQLRGVAAMRADQIAIRGPALRILARSVFRLVAATTVLSAACVLGSPWTELSISLLVAFGCLALATLLVTLLLSLGHPGKTLFAVSAGLATEAVLELSHSVTEPGGALIAGAAVSIVLVLPQILRLFARPGRVLATAIWIP
jgi:hypothetical protein